VGERGVTVLNQSSREIHVRISGAGDALPKADPSLKPGEAAAFFLDRPGDYTTWIKGRGRVLKAALTSQ
jgi:hypothetical protein